MLLDYMAETSGPERKFGCLLEMCAKSPVNIGASTSKSFSERMMSCANLLADARRLKFGDDIVDKLIVLRMNKKSMDRMRSETTFATMEFDDMCANERIKV